MSMVFQGTLRSTEICPGCRTPCTALKNDDIECTSCGMTFSTTFDLKGNFEEPSALIPQTTIPETHRLPRIPLAPALLPSQKRKRIDDDEDEMGLFHRVRVLEPRSTPGRCKLFVWEKEKWKDCGIGLCRVSLQHRLIPTHHRGHILTGDTI